MNVAKLQALDNAGVAAVGKHDRAAAMQRVVDAQRAFDSATAAPAAAESEIPTAKQHWQQFEKPGM